MLGQHHKFDVDVDLLSYFLDAKLKHCGQMQLETKFSFLARNLKFMHKNRPQGQRTSMYKVRKQQERESNRWAFCTL